MMGYRSQSIEPGIMSLDMIRSGVMRLAMNRADMVQNVSRNVCLGGPRLSKVCRKVDIV